MEGNGNGHGHGSSAAAVLEQPLIKSPFSISINADFFSPRASRSGGQTPTALLEMAETQATPNPPPESEAGKLSEIRESITTPGAESPRLSLQMPRFPPPVAQPVQPSPAVGSQPEVHLQGAGIQEEAPWKMLFFLAVGILIWMWMDRKGVE